MSPSNKAVFLPQTDFPMKAGLSAKEPSILQKWQNLYQVLQEKNKDKPLFILHDGPPYANGHIHLGTALNKILKDITLRTQRLLGKNTPYVPGWDCHGLPIEWKIEERYRSQGKGKDQTDILTFRQECRAFAEEWLQIQREEFKRLGIIGDWENPYSTMTNRAEALIVGEISRFLLNGGLYQGAKPVFWSVVEKTALAEAEVEYHDKVSTTIYVGFPIVHTDQKFLKGAECVIWTTTPWTLVANQAIAYNAQLSYVLLKNKEGRKCIIAEELAESFKKNERWQEAEITQRFFGNLLNHTVCSHPLWKGGYSSSIPLLAGDHVTAEAGTGLVHIAPAHGIEDFELGQKYALKMLSVIEKDGTYKETVPLFAGQHIFRGEPLILEKLMEVNALIGQEKITHSYPHSWRSKAPLIYWATPQWFISMTTNNLRENALQALDHTRFIPTQGLRRLQSMVETRPDWCISRQRAWGVPLCLFVHKTTGEVLRDEKVQQRLIEAVEAEGSDVWFSSDSKRFLGDDYNSDDYEKVMDIVDVWFDSGSTHAYVLEDRSELNSPADLYLEGSDQHRGWFQSSLLESCGTRGQAPYRAILTHGFVLDDKGRKMSKSLNNVIAPEEIIDKCGADILRLWAAISDYTQDLKMGPEILKLQEDIYRRFRNTLRYLLGNLKEFTRIEYLRPEQMPDLEQWVLHRLTELDQLAQQCFESFDFHAFYHELHHFCAIDLSAFYFDIRKDSLYCDGIDNPKRKAARTVLNIIFEYLTHWLAPVLCFTAEEAWTTYCTALEGGNSLPESTHLRDYISPPTQWRNADLAQQWEIIRQIRRIITGALEKARHTKKIGSSLQARVLVFIPQDRKKYANEDLLSEICIVSGVEFSEHPLEEAFTLEEDPSIQVIVKEAEGQKCQRCWKILPEVEADYCHRCHKE